MTCSVGVCGKLIVKNGHFWPKFYVLGTQMQFLSELGVFVEISKKACFGTASAQQEKFFGKFPEISGKILSKIFPSFTPFLIVFSL